MDTEKIELFGPFAAAISYIIYFANQNKKNKTSKQNINLLYRGLKLTREEIDMYKPGTKKHLVGYTSTTKKF